MGEGGIYSKGVYEWTLVVLGWWVEHHSLCTSHQYGIHSQMMYIDESWREVCHLWCMCIHRFACDFQKWKCILYTRYDRSYLVYALGATFSALCLVIIMTWIFAVISCNVFILPAAQGVCKYPTKSFTLDCSWLQVWRVHLWLWFNTGSIACQHCYTDCSANYPSTHKGSTKILWETLYENRTNC